MHKLECEANTQPQGRASLSSSAAAAAVAAAAAAAAAAAVAAAAAAVLLCQAAADGALVRLLSDERAALHAHLKM